MILNCKITDYFYFTQKRSIMVAVITNQFIQQYARATVARVAIGAFNFIPAAEMAIRAVGDVFKLTPDSDKEELRWKNFSANSGGVLMYGLLGLNFIPSTAIIGVAVFIIHSLWTYDEKKDNYLTSKCIHFVVSKVISPVLTKIFSIVEPILKGIGTIVSGILKAILIPEHPSWFIAGTLVVAIVGYRFLNGIV